MNDAALGLPLPAIAIAIAIATAPHLAVASHDHTPSLPASCSSLHHGDARCW